MMNCKPIVLAVLEHLKAYHVYEIECTKDPLGRMYDRVCLGGVLARESDDEWVDRVAKSIERTVKEAVQPPQ